MDYVNVSGRSAKGKLEPRREVSHPRLVAIMMQEQSWGKKVSGDIIGPRGVFLDLIRMHNAGPYARSSYKLACLDDQVFIVENRHQLAHSDMYGMCGPNFEAIAAGETIPVKNNNEKYNVAVLHDFLEADGLDAVKALITCEADAVLDLDKESLENNIKFKVKGDLRSMERPVLQSHLAGRSKLIVGMRNSSRYLREVIDYDIDQEYIKNGLWLRKLQEVCTFIVQVARARCANNDQLKPQEMMLQFSGDGLIMHNVPLGFTPAEDVEVLPQWFVDHRHQLALASSLSSLQISKQEPKKNAEVAEMGTETVSE